MFNFIENFVIWLVIAILLLFAELSTPGLFFFISFALGALCAAVLAYFSFSLITQCVVGLLISIILFLIMRKYLKHKKLSEVFYGTPHTNIDALINEKGIVLRSMAPHKTGSVKIGGETWRARSEGGNVLQKGTVVFVVRIEGNTVIVKSSR